MGTIGDRVEGEIAAVHELGESLVDGPHVAVVLRVRLRVVVAVSVQHQEVIVGRAAEDLQGVGDGDCVQGELLRSMNSESAPSCQLASEYWNDDPEGTKWYWLVCMITCCDWEGVNSSFRVG